MPRVWQKAKRKILRKKKSKIPRIKRDLDCESTEGTLTGLTNDGIPIPGSDAVRTVPPENEA